MVVKISAVLSEARWLFVWTRIISDVTLPEIRDRGLRLRSFSLQSGVFSRCNATAQAVCLITRHLSGQFDAVTTYCDPVVFSVAAILQNVNALALRRDLATKARDIAVPKKNVT